MAIFKAVVHSNYAQIPNETAQDISISFEARGLLTLLLSMPNDWEVHKSWVVSQSKAGKDKVNAIFDELMSAGYIRKEEGQRKFGKFSSDDYFVFPTKTTVADLPQRSSRSGSAVNGESATTKETVKQKKQETKETLMSPTGSVCSGCKGDGWITMPNGAQGGCWVCGGTGNQPVVNPELTPVQPPKAEKPLNVPFDDFWNLYNKKTGRKKSEAKWKRLSNKDRAAIMEHLPNYIRNTPDVTYRKNPETYLNSESWNDELPNMRAPFRPDYPENQGVDKSIHTKQMTGLASELTSEQRKAASDRIKAMLGDSK